MKTLITHATLATMTTTTPAYGLISDGAILFDRHIQWVGPASEVNSEHYHQADQIIDAKQALVTPGLIDCHTHLVYGGSRANEFEWRLNGMSYAEIAGRGGGIRSTVMATREAADESLYEVSRKRLAALISDGVTTIEIKSGYGLDRDTEFRILKTAARLGTDLSVRVVPTYLGAHAVPPEYQSDPNAYIHFICSTLLPEIAAQNLASAVDVFTESIGFTLAQTEQVFRIAAALGLRVKVHAEQLSDMGASALASRYQALSCDHVEFTPESGVCAMARAGTVAVLLPGAFYCLRETQKPPIALFRKYQVPMAVATDCNPGTSPVTSLRLMLNMACTLFQLTPEEALAGVTVQAARALGLQDQIGQLQPGKCADVVIWETTQPAELAYQIGNRLARQIFVNGSVVPV